MEADFCFARSLIVLRNTRCVKKRAEARPNRIITSPARRRSNTNPRSGWGSFVGTGPEWKSATIGGAT